MCKKLTNSIVRNRTCSGLADIVHQQNINQLAKWSIFALDATDFCWTILLAVRRIWNFSDCLTFSLFIICITSQPLHSVFCFLVFFVFKLCINFVIDWWQHVFLCIVFVMCYCVQAFPVCLGMERSSFWSSTFGDMHQDSEVESGACQQKLCYHTVDGFTINLDVINHQPLVCQEFIITSPKFSYFRWMAWTLCFYALGCMLQLHLQVFKFVNLCSHLPVFFAHQYYFCIYWLGILILFVSYFEQMHAHM